MEVAMRPTLALAGSFLLLVLLALLLNPASLRALDAATAPRAPDYQLLLNPGMEVYDEPYAFFEEIPCRVASGWQPFWYGEARPYWMDTRDFAASDLGGDWVERIEGETSQMILSTQPYTAGLRQQVGGLTPGLGYGFHAALLTIFQTSAPPAVDGTMVKEVGIDPTGGSDPASPHVVWSAPDDHDEGPWDVERVTAAYAQAPTVTVYIRISSPHPSGGLPFLNQSFLDSAILARTGTVSAASPQRSSQTSFLVRWDNAVPSPQGTIRWYDVQWLDEAEGVWHDWFYRTPDLGAVFEGEWDHVYRFRARVWQRYPNGAHLVSPYQEEGDSRTAVGLVLAGEVRTPEGLPAMGATVAVSGTGYTASTGGDGHFSLMHGPLAGAQSITVSHPYWSSPPPLHDLILGLDEVLTVSLTLGPAEDVALNGGFEGGLAGWSALPGASQVVSAPVYSGQWALALYPTTTAGLSQTVILTDAWEPALSFWYRPVLPGQDGPFQVVLTVVTRTLSSTAPVTPDLGSVAAPAQPLTATVPVTVTRVFTPALGGDGWQQFWCYPGLPGAALTGTVTVEFLLQAGEEEVAALYLDAVSLGATAGGPYRVLLPLVLRR
jgi:hypothetical protein